MTTADHSREDAATRIAHLDCSTGVSGDKFLGALLDAGADEARFTPQHLSALATALAPEAHVRVERVRSCGIAAVSVIVEASSQPAHRHWRDVRELLERAELTALTRDRALAVFGALAQAEARAHSCEPDDVHFHEVGALDSITDVVGVCAGLEALGIEELTATPLATGFGTVNAAHGLLPVPAPATAFLLKGLPTVPGSPRPDGTAPGELTTPTGAALLRVLAKGFGPCPPMTPSLTGFGAGTRDIGTPNVCRLTVGEKATPVPLETGTVTVLETNIDHISGEAIGFAIEQLLAEGVLDAWAAPVLMKKGRPAYLFSVLCETGGAPLVAQRIVALTGTLGVRRTDLERLTAPRDIVERETAYGIVRFKVGPHGARPEADDVARIARASGSGFSAVFSELMADFDDGDAPERSAS